MFQHLFHGSPPWLLAILIAGVAVHIGSGLAAIISGAGALVARKGGRAHRRLGTVFFLAMLTMSAAGASLALVAVARGSIGQIANVFGAAFASYLVSTGWLTVRRPGAVVGRAEAISCGAAMVISAAALMWLLPLSLGSQGESLGIPVAAPIVVAGAAALLAALDLKVIIAGGVSGTSRLLRHLWRTCLGMFIATGSFFLRQQADMPAAVRGSPILILLGVAPLLALAFWVVQVRWRSGSRFAGAFGGRLA